MFHMQRWHIYIQAFCYSRKAKTSFQVALNEQTDQQESNPPVCLNPSALCQYDKTMQSFNQLGETYKQQQCALTWVLGGGKFVFRGREGRGNSQAPTTNQQRWGLAAGSVCYETAFCPFQSKVFLSTSPVGGTSCQTWSQNTFFSLFWGKKRTAMEKKTKIGPQKLKTLLFCQKQPVWKFCKS